MTTNRTKQGKQLLIKYVEVEAEELFRILLLAILYISDQHESVTEARILIDLITRTHQQIFELTLLLHRIIHVRRFE